MLHLVRFSVVKDDFFADWWIFYASYGHMRYSTRLFLVLEISFLTKFCFCRNNAFYLLATVPSWFRSDKQMNFSFNWKELDSFLELRSGWFYSTRDPVHENAYSGLIRFGRIKCSFEKTKVILQGQFVWLIWLFLNRKTRWFLTFLKRTCKTCLIFVFIIQLLLTLKVLTLIK